MPNNRIFHLFAIILSALLSAGSLYAQFRDFADDGLPRIHLSQSDRNEASSPELSPDDPELGRLLEQRRQRQQEFKVVSKPYFKAENALHENKREIAEHFLMSRLTELKRLAPVQEPDGSVAKLTPFDFPEQDGSTSCEPLGRIVAARVLGVPYTYKITGSWDYLQIRYGRGYKDPTTNRSASGSWKRLGDPVPLLFRVVPDEEKVPYRAREIYNSFFGLFQGTHEAYLSLLSPRDDLPENFYPPESLRRSNSGHSEVKPLRALPFSEIILVARKPSESERALARDRRVELDVRPVALDALVFLVNRKNPVTNLSLEQIRSIYLAQEEHDWRAFGGDWKEFGDRPMPTVACERRIDSGSRELMDELVVTDDVLDKAGMPKPETAPKRSWPLATMKNDAKTSPETTSKSSLRLAWDEVRGKRFEADGRESMFGPYRAAAANTKAIAYSVHYYERFMVAAPQVRVLAVDGVTPGYETIRTKKYPLVSEVYVVTRKDIAPDSPPARLRDWLLAEEGQRCVRESGYVPIHASVAAEPLREIEDVIDSIKYVPASTGGW